MKANYFDWNERVVAKLRALWAEGMPVRQIGIELGCNASQVIGKAHRLDLPRRQNPVKRVYEKAAPRLVRKPHGNQGYSPLAVAKNRERYAAAKEKLSPYIKAKIARRLEQADLAQPSVQRADRLPVPVGALPPARTCQWTDSPRAPWVFCGCAAVPGFSWCAEHKARVFERRAA